MRDYKTISSSEEFTEFMRQQLFPPAGKVEEIDVPRMKFICVSGHGEPGSKSFQAAIQALYGIAFGLKMGLKFNKLKQPTDYFDFKVAPLEGLWWQSEFSSVDRSDWRWELRIMMPSFITPQLYQQAVRQAGAKHPQVPYNNVQLKEFQEGPVVQLTHIGPYDTETQSVNRLIEYVSTKGYKVAGRHHEIYMGDPRRTKPEKLKTLLRYPVI